MDIRLALMCGNDIPIEDCQLILHQPTLKEIAYIGEDTFYTGAQCLVLNKMMLAEDKTILTETNNFQIFMTIMLEPKALDKKYATQQLLSILFPAYKIAFTPNSILFIANDNNIIIDANNFESLQEVVKQVLCINNSADQTGFNPANEKAKQIAEKLMRGRQRVAAQKGEINSSVLSRYISILTIGLNSMSLNDTINLTLYQLYDLMDRYALYVNWDIDIRSRLAGGKPDSKPDDWMKNIH